MFEEIFHLLSQLGLAAAARPLCELLLDLSGESMSVQQFQQEVRNVLRRYDGDHCAEGVMCTLLELGYAGLVQFGESCDDADDESADGAVTSPGTSPIDDSAVLASDSDAIVAHPRQRPASHEAARGWLDIDGGIYVDVREHGAGTDFER